MRFALAVALAALTLASRAHAEPALFQVGFAVENIDPDAPQFLGGFGQGPATDVVHDSMEVRAMAIRQGSDVVLLAIVDTQGYFAGYQEGPYGVTDARAAAAALLRQEGLNVTPASIIVSSTHSHAAPTIMGIWGAVDPIYLQKVYQGTVDALVAAAHGTAPAHLYAATADVSAVDGSAVSQTDAYQGWRPDGALPVLWARHPETGATLGLYANVPVHADLVIGVDEGMISADHIGVERQTLEGHLGGTAVVAMGTLGRQESFVQASGFAEADRVGAHITNEIERALASARPITDPTLAAAEQYIAAPVTNPLLAALAYGNLAGPFCVELACTIDRSVLPPYAVGPFLGTWVTALRIGDLVYASEPGEAFPEVSASIRKAIVGPSEVRIVGMAQDQLGYYYPAETYPWTFFNNSDHHIYNASLLLADENVAAHALNAVGLGFAPAPAHETSFFDDPAQATRAGVQFIPIPREQALANGVAEFVFEAATSGAALRRAPSAATLGNLPNLLDQSAESIQWSFGDGGTLVSDSKLVTHSYDAAGTYTVTATVIDPVNGEASTWTQRAFVDPPLAATVTQDGDRLTAGVAGGQGTLLAAHWSFSDGSTAEGVTANRPGGATGGTVSVVDGAGNRAVATF